MEFSQHKGYPSEAMLQENSSDAKPSLEAESYLQNLGFTLIDGKPRFKLDNDIPQHDSTKDYSVSNTDDNLSFVVLGKSSMDSIQASSLASYVDIQKKAVSIDYNSMISSLNSNEIHQKLTELLQENGKLKETLKQNNMAMKQQFNTLASWQEEIMKVHTNHKQKFAETRELINYLKKQNAELKQKLDNSHIDDAMGEYKMIDTADLKSALDEIEAGTPMTAFQEKVGSFSKELNFSNVDCGKSTNDLNKSCNTSDFIDLLKEQKLNIKSFHMDVTPYESDKLSDKIAQSLPNSLKQSISIKSCEKCNAREENIKNLSEFISLLEYKLKHAVALIQFCIKNSTSSTGRHINSIQRFNKELTEIFASEIERFPELRDYLNDFIVETVKDATLSESDSSLNDNEACSFHGESFSKRYKRLIEDNLLNKEKQETTKAENQTAEASHKSSFSDPDTMIDNVSKFSCAKNTYPESLQRLIEKTNATNGAALDACWKNLEQEKKFIEAQKRSLEAEYKDIDDTRKLLQQERISLNEEKTSLDKQSQLYEDHEKTFQMEKKLCEIKCDQLSGEVKALQDELERKELNVKMLQKQVQHYIEEKSLLETQLKIYEEDFQQEKRSKQSLLEEKNKLDTDLQNQFEFNKRLQNEIARLKSQRNHPVSNLADHILWNRSQSPVLTPPEMSNLACPKCEHRFPNVQLLESHVQSCLELA